MQLVRATLDRLYFLGGAIGAVCLIVILGLIVLQMMARWTGEVFPGSTDYAGYFMAGASFLALAHALDKGAHIRVNLVLGKMGRWRRYAEIWCYGVAAVTSVYFACYAIKANIWFAPLERHQPGAGRHPALDPADCDVDRHRDAGHRAGGPLRAYPADIA